MHFTSSKSKSKSTEKPVNEITGRCQGLDINFITQAILHSFPSHHIVQIPTSSSLATNTLLLFNYFLLFSYQHLWQIFVAPFLFKSLSV